MKNIIFSTLALCGIQSAFSQDLPNVVFILADDIGYQYLGCYGAEKIKTPNLDEIASNCSLIKMRLNIENTYLHKIMEVNGFLEWEIGNLFQVPRIVRLNCMIYLRTLQS